MMPCMRPSLEASKTFIKIQTEYLEGLIDEALHEPQAEPADALYGKGCTRSSTLLPTRTAHFLVDTVYIQGTV